MRTNNQLYSAIKPAKLFYFNGLTYKEQVAYNNLDKAIKAKDKNASLGNIIAEEVNHVIMSYHFDHPEVFYLDFTKMIYTKTFGGITLELKYRHLDKIQEVNNIISKYLQVIKSKPNIMGRIVAISDIFYNFTYKNSNRYEEHTIFDPVINKTGVCEGFGLLFAYLCQLSGIECTVLEGTLKGEKHLWNIVEINRRLYNVDMTQSLSTNTANKQVKYAYVLVPTYILEDHKPALRFECESLNDNPFVLLGHAFNDAKTLHNVIESLTKKGKDFTIFDTSKNKPMSVEEIMRVASKSLVKQVMWSPRYTRVIVSSGSWVKNLFS